MSPIQRLRSVSGFIGIDRSIAVVLLSRGWSTLAGVLTLYMIAHFLRPEEQGFYYAFSSILGVQIFFELGFSVTLMQFVSHERAHLSWTANGTITGDAKPLHRLASLLQVAFRWYGTAAALFFVGVLPAGLIFFQQSQRGPADVPWRLPWVWLAIAESLLLLVSPCYAFLEGTGLVAEVAQVRLATNILTSLALWLALSQGWALLASPIVTTVGVVSSSLWIAWRWRRFFIDLFRTRTKEVISWRLELWPFQWRVSITWLSYYFMSQVAIPVLFRYQGPVVAGQMGLSNSLVMAVLAVGLAWVSTKAPQFGVYVARRDFETLDRLFFRTLKQALSVLGLVSLGMFLAVLLADRFGSAYSRRILPPYLFLFLLGRMMVDCTAYFMSVYLRAHKQEPLLWVSLLNALLVGAATYIFGRFEGPRGVAIASFIAVLISLPVVVWIFNRKRRQWHTAPPVD